MDKTTATPIHVLWGKKAANGEPRWLPLVVHLADTAEVGKILWDEPAPNGMMIVSPK